MGDRAGVPAMGTIMREGRVDPDLLEREFVNPSRKPLVIEGRIEQHKHHRDETDYTINNRPEYFYRHIMVVDLQKILEVDGQKYEDIPVEFLTWRPLPELTGRHCTIVGNLIHPHFMAARLIVPDLNLDMRFGAVEARGRAVTNVAIAIVALIAIVVAFMAWSSLRM